MIATPTERVQELDTVIAQIARQGALQASRAALERAINELEFDIRELCEKQKRALTLVHQIEELITEESV